MVAQVIHLEYLPVGIAIIKGLPDRKSLNDWWRGRSIPASRSGIREALDILHVSYTEQLLTKCYGLSLSDEETKKMPFEAGGALAEELNARIVPANALDIIALHPCI